MEKIFISLLAFLAIALHSFAQSDVSNARWKSEEIIIDGNDNEWEKPLNFYDEKSGILYAICNDKNNLYLDFSVNDEMKMRKMMGSGWTIELSSKEKNKKFKASLIFPAIKMNGMRNMKNADPMERISSENLMVKSYKLKLQSVATKGFKFCQSELPLSNKSGIDIGIGENSDQYLVYEIAIPLKELFDENSLHLNELMTLNITVNALSRPEGGSSYSGERSAGGGRQGGGMSRGGGGRSGGGMSRGGGGGRSGGGMPEGGFNRENGSQDRNSMFESASFKQKFRLVKN